jgi:hypothetical protein
MEYYKNLELEEHRSVYLTTTNLRKLNSEHSDYDGTASKAPRFE